MKKITQLNILILLLFSCETALEIDLPEQPSKLVISGMMLSDRFSSPWDGQNNILISNSIGGLASVDEYIYTDSVPVIDFATVSVTEQNSTNDYLFEFNNSCYCYLNRDFVPESNKTYQLNVSAPGFPTIHAIETMPEVPEYTISDFELTSVLEDHFESHLLKWDLCKLNITINDNGNENNYYRVKVFVGRDRVGLGSAIEYEQCKFKSQDPIFIIEPMNRYNTDDNYFEGKNGHFSDQLFNGENKTFFIEVDKPDTKLVAPWQYIYVEVQSYSENYYQYRLTKKEQRRDVNNILFDSEPIFIHSNIEGGYGIFGGRSVSLKAYTPTTYPITGWIEY